MKKKLFYLCGSPACGKGDLTEGLKDYFKETDPERKVLTHDNGVEMRAAVKDKNVMKYMRECIKSHTAAGTSVPTSISVYIWQKFMMEKHTGNDHEILSGMLRQPDEPSLFNSAVKSFYREYDVYTIYLEVQEEVALERMLGNNREGRDDDKKIGIVKKRLKVFKEGSLPIIETFGDALDWKFLRIDGNPKQSVVLANVLEQIG